MFTIELAERLDKINPLKLESQACIPVQSDIARNLTDLTNSMLYPIGLLTWKDYEHGCQTILYLIFENSENLKNGGYYDEKKPDDANPFTAVPYSRKSLWRKTEELLGISFPVD